MNEIELLKEAIEVLMRGQDDEQANLAQRIEDYLAEPEPDAKWESIISKIRATDSKGEYRLDYWSAQKLIEEFAEQHAEAAALIESYGRRVPRADV